MAKIEIHYKNGNPEDIFYYNPLYSKCQFCDHPDNSGDMHKCEICHRIVKHFSA